jgi:hypothetical protein
MQLRFRAEQRGVGFEVQRHPDVLLATLELGHDIPEHAADIDEIAGRRRLRRLEPHQLDQIAQDLRHAMGLPEHFGDRHMPALGQIVVLGHRVEVAVDHGQRRAQLM